MNKFKPVLAGLLAFVAGIVAIPLAPVVVAFARRDSVPTPGSWDSDRVIRGNLPRGFGWMETPDERLPGGLYEPTVRKRYDRYGFYWTSVCWLVRNRAHGLRKAFAKPATEAQYVMPQTPGLVDLGGGLWRYIKPLGPFKFLAGYRVYRSLKGELYASPSLTIKAS